MVEPDGVVVEGGGAGEGAGEDEGGEREEQEAATAKETAGKRKEEVEHLLNGERPEDVPAWGQVAAARFEQIDVEVSAAARARVRPPVFGDDEVLAVREVQAAEDSEQQEQQGRDPGEAELVELAQVDGGDRTPAAQRCGCDEESGDGEEYLHDELPVPDEREDELCRQAASV